MTYSTTEYATIQKPSIEFLEKLGYEYISQEKALELRGGNLSNVLLKDILAKKLKELNTRNFVIDKAIKELDVSLDKGLKEANREITNLLTYGTATQAESQKGKKSQNLRYIDFDNPSNNHFCVAEEFSVKRKIPDAEGDTRRPDLVLFINGIPFCVIELKSSKTNIQEGISQLIRNQNEKNEIPNLFKFIQICIAGNNQEAKYGTIFTSSEFYSLWEEENKENNPFTPQAYGVNIPDALDKLFASLLHKDRILKLIQSFIIFDNGKKKVARYQQFFAIQETLKRIKNKNGDERGGLIWHTQGSGKSLTMSILASLIKKTIPSSRIIVVTDREQLDDQIHKTFLKTGIESKRAKSGRHLIELLQNGETVITTLVQKFKAPDEKNISIDTKDIFLLVDESHRTQNGLLHNAMKESIPNGCYIGFTGTPLTSDEKNSAKKFGGFIHKYTIEQALRDKSILPLYYEGRFSEQFINDKESLDKKFEAITKGLTEEEKMHLKNKTARATLSSYQRLEWIALDIQEHFENHFKGTGFVAMFATSSKDDAIAYYKIFKSQKRLRVAFVISSPDTRAGNTAVNEENEDDVIKEWRQILKDYGSEGTITEKFEDGEIDLLIVVDKLLTGFDVPRVACLYLDKSLKDHGLLQAIARVNRLYSGKERGYIIDYRGISEKIDTAIKIYKKLANFDKEDLHNVVFCIKDAIKELRENFSNLQKFFAEIKKLEGQGKFQEIYEQFLEEREKRERFYELLSLFARSLNALIIFPRFKESISEDEVTKYKNALKFYIDLKYSIQIRYHEKIDFKQYESQINKMIHQFIGAKEPQSIGKMLSIFDENFINEVIKQPNDRARADKITGAMTQYIKENRQSNPYFYDEISTKIQKIIDAYKEGRLSEKEKFDELKSIYSDILENKTIQNKQYPKELQKPTSKAFYDSLKGILKDLKEEDIVFLALEIDKIFIQKSKKPEWKSNYDVRNEMLNEIEDVLLASDKHITTKELDELGKQFFEIGIFHYGSKNSL